MQRGDLPVDVAAASLRGTRHDRELREALLLEMELLEDAAEAAREAKRSRK